jgi:hypothetical protein
MDAAAGTESGGDQAVVQQLDAGQGAADSGSQKRPSNPRKFSAWRGRRAGNPLPRPALRTTPLPTVAGDVEAQISPPSMRIRAGPAGR